MLITEAINLELTLECKEQFLGGCVTNTDQGSELIENCTEAVGGTLGFK